MRVLKHAGAQILRAIITKQFWVDTLALVCFSWVVGMAIEVLVAQMTLEQSFRIRMNAMLPNILASGVIARYRDWVVVRVMRCIKRVEPGKWVENTTILFADMVAFATSQTVLYMAIMWMSGATRDQIIAAATSVTTLSLAIGTVAGVFIDTFRVIFRVQPQMSDNTNSS